MYIEGPGKKQTKYEKTFEKEKDLLSTLHQISVDIREEYDQEMYKDWGIPPKMMKWCRIKTFLDLDGNTNIQLLVDELSGGYRINKENPKELEKKGLETKKLLDKFEKSIRNEFKKRTGKTLKISKGDTIIDWELIALNGLYRFYAIKTAEVKTELDGQTYPENEKELASRKLENKVGE